MRERFMKAGAVACAAAGLFFASTLPVFVHTEVKAEEATYYENLHFQEINQMLTEEALQAGIPPEVVKAVAKKESGWKQFENGKPLESTSGDGGYGIMQITNFAGFEDKKELIKTDTRENIKAGVQILKDMYERSDLPKVKNADPEHLESWYFPVMAYNGIKPVNSPLVQGTGERNESTDDGKKGAYQEDVFAFIETEHSMPKYALRQFPFNPTDFDYNPDSPENIKFKVAEYMVENLHKSVYYFDKGDQVEVKSAHGYVNLRKNPRTDEPAITQLTQGTVLTITGPFEYDERPKSENMFVYYPVKTADGTTGYVASRYIQESSKPLKPALPFTDVAPQYEEAVAFLVSKGILGYSDHTFRTEKKITRDEAAVMLVRVLGLDTENAPPSGFKDLRAFAAKEVNALKAEGITNGTSETTFGSEEYITRGDLAVWIARAFQLQGTVEPFPFNDVNDRQFKAVSAFVKNGITRGTTDVTFGTNDHAKRGDYAIFLYRAANIK